MAGGRFADRIRDLLADARELAAAGEWDAVRDLAGAVLALDPSDADAAQLLRDADAAAPVAGERRQLTVMFCDVVGSTALASQQDPESLREVLRAYQGVVDDVVRRHGGSVAMYIGDGTMAYFGHPVPHEDDARRAVRAGLELLRALRPVVDDARQRLGIELAVRIAVHTGLVVRAEMGSASTPDRDAIVGQTPNLAARLQDHARPDTLLISGDTYDLVRGWFLVVPAGELALRGFDQPVAAYEVVDETPAESRIQAQVALSPFIGRAAELDRLQELWHQTVHGGSHAALVVGEPGIGKTRLADIVQRRALAEGGSALVATCSTLHEATALHPARRLIERAVGIDPGTEPRRALSLLWEALEALGEPAALPVLADLLGLPPTDWCPAPELDGPKLREVLLDTLVRWLGALAGPQPLLLVVDDLQWADPTTLELVGRIIARRIPGLLVVLTARPELQAGWSSAERIELGRLSPEDLTALAARVPGAQPRSRRELEQLIERSDGVPLYLEQLLRTAGPVTGSRFDHDLSIPPALRDLLLARFSAPGVDMGLSQLLATMGDEVDAALLEAVWEGNPAVLANRLRGLLDAGIIDHEVLGDRVTYRFRHHLLAELAYATQLRPARQRNHDLVADALLTAASTRQAPPSDVLAHHLERAGRPSEAVGALLGQAQEAMGFGATTEATSLLTHALELLEDVTDPAEAARLEVEVRLARGTAAAGTLGYAAPAVVEDFHRCHDLTARADVGVDPDVLIGLWSNNLLQGRLDDAEAISRGQLARMDPADPMVEVYELALGFIDFFRGDCRQAARRLESAHAALARVDDRRWPVPHDTALVADAHLAHSLLVAADLRGARDAIERALDRSAELPFPRGPFSRCYALSMAVPLHGLLEEREQAATQLAALLELADKHGFTFWSVVANLVQATEGVRTGEPGAAAQATNTIALLRALGIIVWLPTFLTTLAAAHLEAGEPGEALRHLEEASELADQTGARCSDAETARLLGETRLAVGDPAGLDDLARAVDIAAAQGAMFFELRARTARCQRIDDPTEHKELAALLDRLPEGFDHPDAAGAAAVLGERR